MGDPSGTNVLQRWSERADGRMELLELPLTPELFLDPQLGDKILQGSRHLRTTFSLYGLISRHLSSEPGTYVFSDLKHLIGPGLGPAPDISVVRGLAPDRDFESYDLRSEVPPCFVIEIVSPSNPRIRRTDEVDKVKVYEKVGIEEYLLVPPSGEIPNAKPIHVFDLESGERLLADEEQEEALRAQKEELARLRAEIERLKRP